MKPFWRHEEPVQLLMEYGEDHIMRYHWLRQDGTEAQALTPTSIEPGDSLLITSGLVMSQRELSKLRFRRRDPDVQAD